MTLHWVMLSRYHLNKKKVTVSIKREKIGKMGISRQGWMKNVFLVLISGCSRLHTVRMAFNSHIWVGIKSGNATTRFLLKKGHLYRLEKKELSLIDGSPSNLRYAVPQKQYSTHHSRHKTESTTEGLE